MRTHFVRGQDALLHPPLNRARRQAHNLTHILFGQVSYDLSLAPRVKGS